MPPEPISLPIHQPGPSTGGLPLSPAEPVRSLYIHVPFCFHKCHYCDFYSFVDAQDRQGAFVEALGLELRHLGRRARAWDGGTSRTSLKTVFIGGGTPSLLRPDLWRQLLDDLHSAYELSSDRCETEFTVECNPETVTSELMAVLKSGGVNRVSIGAQSFHEPHLKVLERWHDPANVERALQLAAEAGISRRSIDLIFGIPGQSIADWRSDLEAALSLQPPIEHISCYALTYEPNTAMTRRVSLGEVVPIDESVELEMFRLTVNLLRDRGYDRYEVSNFARPGAECRHNLAYWRQDQWFAAGPSASGHIAGVRWKNIPRLTEWMEGVSATGGESPVVDVEPPDPGRALRERIMTGLRLSEGLDEAAILAESLAFKASDRLRRTAERHARSGLLIRSSGRWRLTDEGFLFADSIAAEMMSAVGT